MKTRLKELREDHDLTQEQCAKIAYISKNSYIRYEKGERVPPLDIIVMYAKYYNTSIDYIACLTDTNQNLFQSKQLPLFTKFTLNPTDLCQ